MYKIDKYIPPRNLIPISNQIQHSDEYYLNCYYITNTEFICIIRNNKKTFDNKDIIIKIDSVNINIGPCNDNYVEKNIQNDLINLIPINLNYNQKIPKIIYQTSNFDELDLFYYNTSMSFIDLNPEYTYKFYNSKDRRNFIKENFDNKVLDTYDLLIPGAYQADLFRLCILYVIGGCYFDMKFKLNVSLREIILEDDNQILCKDRPDNAVANGCIMTVPNNMFLLDCINEIVQNVKNNFYGDGGIYPTGPVVLWNNTTHLEKTLFFTRDENNNNDIGKIVRLYDNKILMECDYKKYYDEYNKIHNTTKYWELWYQKKIYYKVIIENENYRILSVNNILKNSIIIKNNYLINLNNFDIEVKIVYKNNNDYRELTINNIIVFKV